jgi:hypothetical protein
MDKGNIMMPESDNKTIALVMFIAGIIVWFLIDSTKPLAHDLLKAIAFFLFGYGLICLMKWKSWGILSAREKKMRIIFYAIVAFIIVFTVLLVLLRS